MSHTPGPWAVTSQSSAGRYINVHATGDVRRCVARVQFSSEDDPNPSDASDAYLIASAPDLLAALHGLLDFVSERAMAADHGLIDARIGNARAAIRKAES